jgi:hypothetical protein
MKVQIEVHLGVTGLFVNEEFRADFRMRLLKRRGHLRYLSLTCAFAREDFEELEYHP